MKKLLITILLSLLPFGLVKADPYVSPQGCLAITGEIIQIAFLRDAKIPQEDIIKSIPSDDPFATNFYTFWIKTVYGSKEAPDVLAQTFYKSCIAAQGDLGKLTGLEV
ncbi:MAG: hypothetical protein NUV80_06485 [Candidatus Berkelbacteria bacterium]|nr:hypothetical protein [Candidatus Berkelbacteria bacterium]